MGIIEEIKTMQREGRSESDISQLMQSHGYAPEEVQEALAQSRIREAVAGGTPEMPASDSPHGPPQSFSHISGMEPSMLSPAQSAQQSPQTGQYQVPEQNNYTSQVNEGYPPQYQDYQQYPGNSMSTDVITELVDK